jgi:hypothetical protein
MKKYAITILLLAAVLYAAGQDKLIRKLNDYRTIVYSNDQEMFLVSKGNDIVVFPKNAKIAAHQFEDENKSDITSLHMTPNGTDVMAISEKGIGVWRYISGKKVFGYKSPKSFLAGVALDDNHAAVITENELQVIDVEKSTIVFTKTNHSKFLRCIGASPDGKLIITGGGDFKVITQDGATGAVLNEFTGHKGVIRAVDASPDGNWIASGDDKGVVHVTNHKGEIKFTFDKINGWVRALRFSPDSKYLVICDDNAAINIVSVATGLLAEKRSGGYNPVVSLVFSPDGKELSFTTTAPNSVRTFDVKKLEIVTAFKVKDTKDATPPQIYVSSPPNITDDKVKIYKEMVEIRGTLMDDAGILSLKINNINVPIKQNNNFVIIQPLAMGDNPFTIEAKDLNENIAIKRFTITRKNMEGEQYDVAKARNFLFVVGINDYEHWPKLNNAVKDANDISTVLLSKYNFSFENVIMLKNEQATRSNIYKSLRSLIEQVTPQDNLVIYFSGHGYFDGLLNEGYWIPIDAEVNNSGDYLSNSDLLKIIGNIDSQHTFLIADACFSGSLFADSKRGYAENVERFKSRWGLASGRLEVVSDGAAGQNSPFAAATIGFLNDNTKEKLAISELIHYVKMKVAETSDQTPLGNPLKVLGDEGGELVLYLKK